MKKLIFVLLLLSLNCQLIFAQNDDQTTKVPLNRINVEYKDGKQIAVYDYNDVMVGVTKYNVKEYGKYFKIYVYITNYSDKTIDFDPKKVTATIKNKKGDEKQLEVMSSEDYIKKVNRKQSWESALFSYSENSIASTAGETVILTESNTNVAKKSGSYHSGTVKSTTNVASNSAAVVVNSDAKIKAMYDASDRISEYKQHLRQEQDMLKDNYLKRNTIHPKKDVKGYIYIPFTKGTDLTISININGVQYTFPFDQL